MPRAVLALLVALCLACATYAEPARYDHHSVVRATIRTVEDLQTLQQLSPDVWSHRTDLGEVDFRIPPENLAALEASGVPFRVLIENVQALIDAERASLAADGPAAGIFDNFRTYSEVVAFLDSLAALNPDLASRVDIGQSIEGRPIPALLLRSPASTTPRCGSDRPAILINGCQHAREWVSVMVPLFIANHLTTNYGSDPAITNLLDNLDVYIVPIVNPDGYTHSWSGERLWRKNRRPNLNGSFGVDNNRNWGYEWGGAGASTNPGDETYRGTAPFSEPETRAMRDFFLAHPNIRATIDFHAYSQLILSPWAYSLIPTPDAVEYHAIGQSMATAIAATPGGLPYTVGPVASTLYIASGGSVDWTYGSQGVFSWTIELRDTGVNGFILPASQILPTCNENLSAFLTLANWAHTTDCFRMEMSAPTLAAPNTPTPVDLSIRSLPGATLNPQSVSILARSNPSAPFSPVAIAQSSAAMFTGSLPAASCGHTLEFYASASSVNAITSTLPPNAPASVFSLPVVVETTTALDELEAPSPVWTVGAPGDTATTGIWIRADPVGTSAQPEDDHTPAPGVNCYVTGNAAPGASAGSNDVDNGATTLTSPTLDASGPGDHFISAWIWYHNGGSADTFPISLSNDNGATWTQIALLNANTGGWVQRTWRIADHMTPTSTMKIRFVARDDAPGSIVEAAVDDVRIFRRACDSLPGDLNGDGAVNFADLNIVLSNFGATGAPGIPGDANNDGVVNFADLNIVLSNFGQSI